MVKKFRPTRASMPTNQSMQPNGNMTGSAAVNIGVVRQPVQTWLRRANGAKVESPVQRTGIDSYSNPSSNGAGERHDGLPPDPASASFGDYNSKD